MIKLLYWLFCWIILGRAPRVDDRKACNRCSNGYLQVDWFGGLAERVKLANPLCNNGFCYECCMTPVGELYNKDSPSCMCIRRHVKLTNSEIEV